MTKFADPGFVMHTAIGKFLTLMLYCLVDEEIVPLEPANYGVEMRAWLKELEGIVKESNTKVNLDLGELENSVAVFEDAARQFNAARNMAVSSNSSVFAPGVDTGYAPVTYPGVTEAVVAGNTTLAEEFVGKTAKAILAAANILL